MKPTERLKRRDLFRRTATIFAFVFAVLSVGSFYYSRSSARLFFDDGRLTREVVELRSEATKKELSAEAERFFQRNDSLSSEAKKRAILSGWRNLSLDETNDELGARFEKFAGGRSDAWNLTPSTVRDCSRLKNAASDFSDAPTVFLEFSPMNAKDATIALFDDLATDENDSEIDDAIQFLQEISNSPVDSTNIFADSQAFLVASSESLADYEKNPLDRLLFLTRSELIVREPIENGSLKATASVSVWFAFFCFFGSFGFSFPDSPLFAALTDSVRLLRSCLETLTRRIARFFRLKSFNSSIYFFWLGERIVPLSVLQTESTRLLF